MPKAETKPKSKRPKAIAADAPPPAPPTEEELRRLARRAHLRRELTGIALLLASVFIAGSLLAGGAAEGQSCTTAGSIFGPVGSCMRSVILWTLGSLAAVIVPFITASHALRLLGRIEQNSDRRLLF